jgi:2-phosphosulfolactate phosphatase
MVKTLEVVLAPPELGALARRDLSAACCVVLDVLRATTTMVTALANGAQAVVPVAEIPDALELRARHPGVLLAGERDGVRILAALTGGADFDLGNSPREFTPQRVRGRTIVMTTTNGTRALRACAGAGRVLVGALLNLGAVARAIEQACPASLVIVCSGTLEQAAYEDTLAAGALCDLVWPLYAEGQVADSALIARGVYQKERGNLLEAIQSGRNGRRLSRRPELRDDVALCAQRDAVDLVAQLLPDGQVRRV